MKGYKAFNKDMTCRDFQYEVGGKYELDEELKICKRGFHFCKNIIDVYAYYEFSENTIVCEVIAHGDILQEGMKFCTNKIEIGKPVSWEYIQSLIKDEHNNTGLGNSGNYNSGNYNSGYYNNGNYNSGLYNSGNHNSGFFNSNTPTVRLFNKDSGLTYEEFDKLDIDWHCLTNSKETIMALPNYDAQIFYEATGIDWREENDN